jgi:DNA polymerase (family 10)
MTNKAIASQFQYLASLMELHGENKFKIRSYSSAYINIRKQPEPLLEKSQSELEAIKGIGKSTASKIRELADKGAMDAILKMEEKTPEGVREMLQIKGFGAKKVGVIWKELEVETIGELLYACNENRLVELKGFGQKTQADLKSKLEYFEKSRDKFRYGDLEADAMAIIDHLKTQLPDARIELTGEMRRRCNIINRIEILLGNDGDISQIFDNETFVKTGEKGNIYNIRTENDLPVKIYHCQTADFGSKQFRYSASEEFLNAFLKAKDGVDFKGISEEKDVFAKAELPYIEPELREQDWGLELAQKNALPTLLELTDIKGIVHNHSTYSDGINTLREMAEATRDLGYEYLVMSDHSKAAFYANGLKEDRLMQQWAEIDALNKEMAPFRIFKSIESDILNDGSLDYADDILAQFDLVIASVHTNLRMDKEKATQRILTAIENPYTTILGHPTGRLLLSRTGYPLDHKRIIDACAANGVSIELNANPYRLDMDWTWIPYAREQGVLIAINPDAHSVAGIKDVRFGVLSARKGGLTKEGCLNAKGLAAFEAFLK